VFPNICKTNSLLASSRNVYYVIRPDTLRGNLVLLPRAAYPQVGWCGFVQEGFILLKYHTQYCPRVFDKMRVVPGTVARGTLFPPSLLLVLTKNAGKILTDSGGLQKEAYFAKVPCITLDTVSAWPETVEDGWNIVVGEETVRQQLRRESIINAVRSFEPNKKQQNIFGNGKAAEKICDLLVC
jgi:hypothetical protein